MSTVAIAAACMMGQSINQSSNQEIFKVAYVTSCYHKDHTE